MLRECSQCRERDGEMGLRLAESVLDTLNGNSGDERRCHWNGPAWEFIRRLVVHTNWGRSRVIEIEESICDGAFLRIAGVAEIWPKVARLALQWANCGDPWSHNKLNKNKIGTSTRASQAHCEP